MSKTVTLSMPVMTDEEIAAVASVLRSGKLAQGPRVEDFEQRFASYVGTKYAIATNSGTSALHTALLAHGIGKGDEVITTPFSFIATANSILCCAAKPVFVDIDEKTFDIHPDLIEEKITPNTKAVLPVHLYGGPCEMAPIMEICRKHGLALIEDAAQALGAEYYGKKVGSFGTGCFSFYATKNITTGEGGMVTTNDKRIAETARMIRDHGQSARYIHQIIGYNYRMTEIAAAIGLCQLDKLEQSNVVRISNAAYLTSKLSGIRGIKTPEVKARVKHVFHQYTIRVTKNFTVTRDKLKQQLEENGIFAAVYYPLPIHKQPLYERIGYDAFLPISETISEEVLSLPVHPNLTEEDLVRIGQSMQSISKSRITR